MAVGDLAEVNVIYLKSDDLTVQENVFGFKALTSGATRSGLATAFKTALVKSTSGGLLNVANGLISSDRLTVSDVKPGTGAEVELDYAAVVGATAGEALPPQCAQVISWRTSLAGRSFRGRSYLPAPTENVQNAGILNSTQQTALAAIVTQMLAVFGPSGSDGNWQFCVISRVSAGAPRVPPIGTEVTVGVVRTSLQTQRRRNN
jgi:hypothetical protein